MEKQKSKKTRKLLAVVSLALGGAIIGSSILTPFFVLKNWRSIQYDIVDIKQDFVNTTDKSLSFKFQFNDSDTLKLNRRDINVALIENPDDQEKRKEVQTGVAQYLVGERSWQFQSDLQNKLKAGTKYEIVFKGPERKFGEEKLKFNVVNSESRFIFTKANVKSFEFENISPSEKKVIVSFSDDVKSLENKNATLRYYYVTVDSEGKEIKTQDSKVSENESAKIIDNKATFVLKGLVPNRKYVIEYVAYYNDGKDNGILNNNDILIPYSENVVADTINTFQTINKKIYASKISYLNVLTNKAQVMIGLSKANDEPETSLNGNRGVLKYKLKGTNEIKEIESQLIQDTIIFDFNASNEQKTLLEGSIYEIISVEIDNADVEWSQTVIDSKNKINAVNSNNQLFLETKVGVSNVLLSNVQSRTATVTLEIINQDNKDKLENSSIEISLDPFNEKAIAKQTLVKKPNTDNVYVATFNVEGLSQGINYAVDQVKVTLNDQEKTVLNIPFIDKYNEKSSRSFTTLVTDAEILIQGTIAVTHNSASVNMVFNAENRFINGNVVVLKYQKVNPQSTEIFTQEAIAAANSVKFNLGGDVAFNTDSVPSPLDSGTVYKIVGVELKDSDISLNLSSPENVKTFTTNSKINKIEYQDISDTSAKVKITFSDWKNTLLQEKNENNEIVPVERKAKIIYQVIGQQSSPSSTALVKITEEGVTFTLNNLLKGMQYQIISIQLDPELNTFYSEEISSRTDNQFTTTASDFIVGEINVEAIKEKSAEIKVAFDLSTDLILVNKSINIHYKVENAPDDQEIVKMTTVDEVGEAKVVANDLQEGTKYVVTRITPVAPDKYNFTIPESARSSREFYTKAAISNLTVKNITENSAELHFEIVNSDPEFVKTNKTVKVNYVTSDGIANSLETQVEADKFAAKRFVVKLSNLNKVTDYTIERISLNGLEFLRTANFNDASNNFRTSATSAKIINLSQTLNSENAVNFEMSFDANVDSFMNQKSVIVQLQKENAIGQPVNEIKEFKAQVNESIISFQATNLESGSKYNIINLKLETPETPEVNIAFADSVTQTNRFVFTKPIVQSFAFDNIGETTAQITVNFADSQNEYQNKNVRITYRDKNNISDIFEISSSTSSTTINNNSISLNLSSLNKFTSYEIVSVKVEVSTNNYEEITLNENINKEFKTLANNVNVQAKVTDISPTSAKLTYTFDNIDWYLKNQTVTLTYNHHNEENKTLETQVVEKFGVLTAEYDLTDLPEGSTINVQGLSVANINFNNDETQFNTLGVIKTINISDINETSAKVVVEFQNEDSVRTFNDKQATLKFAAQETGTIKLATATVVNNRVEFNLSKLNKITAYNFVDLKVELDNYSTEIPLSKTFTEDNKNAIDTKREFSTTATSATVTSLVENSISKTTNSVSLTFSFDRIIDGFLANKQATLTFVNRSTMQETTTSAQTINPLTSSVTFDLNSLEEGGSFAVKSINVDNVAIAFADTINKNFSLLPVVKTINKTIPQTIESDSQIGLRFTFNDLSNLLNNKRVLLSISSTQGFQAIYTSDANVANNEISFNLTNLPKNNNFKIDELLIDGNAINFVSTLDESDKQFTTSAKQAILLNSQMVNNAKDRVNLILNFDTNKDWYLVNKNIQITFKDSQNNLYQTSNFAISEDGIVNANINSSTLLNSKELISGEKYYIESILVQDNDLNTNISLNSQRWEFETTPVINSVTIPQVSENPTIKVKFTNYDLTILENWYVNNNQTGENAVYVSYTNKNTGQIYKEKLTTLNIDKQDKSISFNLNPQNLVKNGTYSFLGISLGTNVSPIVDFEPTVTEQSKEFRILATYATVTSINYKYLDETKTKIAAIFHFDSTIDSFMNGKAVVLKYSKIDGYNNETIHQQEIVIDKHNNKNIIVSGSTVQFILQGTIDSTGAQQASSGSIQTATNSFQDTANNGQYINTEFQLETNANLMGLIHGSKYRINSLEVASNSSAANTEIRFSEGAENEKEFWTEIAVISFGTDNKGEFQSGATPIITVNVRSTRDLTLKANNAFKITLLNTDTNQYISLNSSYIFKASGTDNIYTVQFAEILQKQSRFKIVDIFVDNNKIIKSPLFTWSKDTKQSFSDQFTTAGNQTWINELEFSKKAANSIQVTVGFVAANENLARLNKTFKIKYKNLATQVEQETQDIAIDQSSNKLIATINNLDEMSTYEIIDIIVNKVDASDTVVGSIAHNANFVVEIPFNKVFSTNPSVTNLTFNNVSDASANILVTLSGDTKYLNNEPATITINKVNASSDQTLVNSRSFTVDNFVSANNTINFSLDNLEKFTDYQVVSLTIANETIKIQPTITKTFKTTDNLATITNISYSNIDNTSANVILDFANSDQFLNSHQVQISLQKLDDSNQVEGQVITASATVNDNKATINVTGLSAGERYRIVAYNRVDKPTTVLTKVANKVLNEEFATLAIISNISITPSERSATVVLTFRDRALSTVAGKIAKLTLARGDELYSQIDSNLTATFVLNNLSKESAHLISSVDINNKQVLWDNSLTNSKTVNTLGNTATITKIEITNTSVDAATVKLTMGSYFKGMGSASAEYVDKYLANKNLKLHYEKVNQPGVAIYSNTVAQVITESSTNGQVPIVTFNLNNNDLTSGTRYIIKGLVDSANQDAIDFSMSNVIEKSIPETKLFETKVAMPTIASARILQTTNPEGQTNTYLSKVELVFNDPTHSLNTNLLNSWEFKFKNSKSGAEKEVSNISFVNRQFTNDKQQGTTTVTFDIKGSAVDWVGIDNKLEIKFSYFENIDNNVSISLQNFIGTLQNGNDIILRTQENFLLDSLSGIISTGMEMEFKIRVYDPNRLLTDAGTETGSYSRAGITNVSRNTTGNSLDYNLYAKKANLNVNGVSVNQNSSWWFGNENRPTLAWINSAQGNGTPHGWNNLIGNSPSGDNVAILNTWKWASEDQPNWININQKINKKILYIKRDNSDQNYVNVAFYLAGSSGNEAGLSSKLFKFDISQLFIQNQIPLFAEQSSKIWQIYHSVEITGSSSNMAGSFHRENHPNNVPNERDRDPFSFGPAPINVNATNGTIDKNVLGLKDIIYDANTGKLDVQIHLPENPAKQGLERKIIYTKQGKSSSKNGYDVLTGSYSYALFLNEKGDIYMFGDGAGRGIDIVDEATYDDAATTATVSFDLKANIIPIEQRPKEGEKLRFVGLVSAFLGGDSKTVHKGLMNLWNWSNFENQYKEIVYKV
ncbi:hypothetical protein [Mesomycoplasma lagogenitalium]|uniref:DUF1410 domain-containing protein n=1 Tax=Mesomycoplasma lagogenitalium TaxID=171286 RepID=A0ABY8LUR0_9BACT|nr:hypothetical protein [Mesomycoplasma lagogenitalium]WGI36283.1 hypothetical protein QEG99_02270 [Mesomycoplasma lagogenitalium]